MPERPHRTAEGGVRRCSHAARTRGGVSHAHVRAGICLIDCGCGPGTITADLAQAVVPGEVIGIDPRDEAVTQARMVVRERGLANLTFQTASIYQLPFPDHSFDAAFTCAVLQHLATPVPALKEIRQVLKPNGVLGVADGSSTVSIRYPMNPLLEKWDRLRVLQREHNLGQAAEMLPLRALLRGRLQAHASLGLTDDRIPARSRRHAVWRRTSSFACAGCSARSRSSKGTSSSRSPDALVAWGESLDAFYARSAFWALGWV